MSIEWKYSKRDHSWTLHMTKTLWISVYLTVSSDYGVMMFGTRSDQTFAAADDAKSYALKVAERHLAFASERLKEFTSSL